MYILRFKCERDLRYIHSYVYIYVRIYMYMYAPVRVCIIYTYIISKISLRFQPFESRKQTNRIETKKLLVKNREYS